MPERSTSPTDEPTKGEKVSYTVSGISILSSVAGDPDDPDSESAAKLIDELFRRVNNWMKVTYGEEQEF